MKLTLSSRAAMAQATIPGTVGKTLKELTQDQVTRRKAAQAVALQEKAPLPLPIGVAPEVHARKGIYLIVDGEEKALTAAQTRTIRQLFAAKQTARQTRCTLVGVNSILPSVKDGDHEFKGWTEQFRFTTELVKQLKAAGIKTTGNYHEGTWAGIANGKVFTITGDKPASAL